MAEQKKTDLVLREEEVLKFWQENNIFEKTLEKESPEGDFVFYDGPPFATGLPHYGHIVASCLKDVFPRYKTMRGYHVPRRWGWDCHGLPIENIVEKELGFETKKDILAYGVDKFNEKCREEVLRYADDWKPVIARIGRFVDMENDYKTMDLSFMESVWWVFKQLWDKDLIYAGYKSMHICPRCETTLSQSEVSQGYETIKDLAVIAKFELTDQPGTYILAWTTTPWTLPGNVALAMNPRIHYSLVESEGERYILSSLLAEQVFEGKEYEIKEDIDISAYEGKKYTPLFPYFEHADIDNKENLYTVQFADFVTEEDGTGIVHIAPAFGEDDMALGKEKNLPFIQHVGIDGIVKSEVSDFAGMSVKPKGDHQTTDIEIIKYLAGKNLLFSKQKYEHNYPHCWRCDTPLLNYAKSSYFVKVTELKDTLLKNNEEINWQPEHLKDGRAGNWLEGARDWAISRERFWGSVMPLWKCESCDEEVVIGSVTELEEKSGKSVTDIHKHIIDEVTFDCECGGTMKRIPEILDTWFDSGSMPFAQNHYMGEPQKGFDPERGINFPADYIAEGIDQTRCWFYYLNVISSALTKNKPFKNVVVNGIILAEDGQKMSKKLKNYPDPMDLVDRYGADALRYYLLSSPVVRAEDVRFSEEGVDQVYKKVLNTLWNVYSFFELYRGDLEYIPENISRENVLDRWIISQLQRLIETVTEEMEGYDLINATRPIEEFIQELSTWYVRRSRDRFKGDNVTDKEQALLTTQYVLTELAKIMAPSMPFMAEALYQKLSPKKQSVHLEEWPSAIPEWLDAEIEKEMAGVREIIEHALAVRAEAGVKVRQPLQTLFVTTGNISDSLVAILLEEVNVKDVLVTDTFPQGESVVVHADENAKVALDTTVTPELAREGSARELVRHINALRKKQGLSIGDRADVTYSTASDAIKETISIFGEDIVKQTLSDSLEPGDGSEEVKVNGEAISLTITKK